MKDFSLISGEVLAACKEILRLNSNKEHKFEGYALLEQAVDKMEGRYFPRRKGVKY